MDLEARLASMALALSDGHAELSTDLGDHHEQASARLWRGEVLVDWEPDAQAGGCLLRPDLVRRLAALHAHVEFAEPVVRIVAPGRIVSSLSPAHADVVARLGGARHVEMRVTLRFEADAYLGGQEIYYALQRGQRIPLLRLSAEVRAATLRKGSPRTSPAPR